MADTLPIHRTESIREELDKMHERVMNRAYEIFESHGHVGGHDLDDWLSAERELVWEPSVEVEETERELTVKVSAPGIDPKDVELELTPEDLLVEAETHQEHQETKGTTQTSELFSTKLFRAIHLPRKIDPSSAKAELKNGVLEVTARLAEQAHARKAKVAVA